jgi:hypothetical protein
MFRRMRLLIAGCLCAVAITGIAVAQTLSIIPAPGAPQTFSVAFHSDEPHQRAGDFEDILGVVVGGPGEDPTLGDVPDYLRDQKGTMTFTRTSSTVTITTDGALDSFYSPIRILARGVLDPGGPPERFIVAFDNALASFADMPSAVAVGGSWNGAVQALTGLDALGSVPILMKATSVTGTDVVARGTGQANLTITIGDNDLPATFEVTVNAEIAAGRLRSYEETITRTITSQGHMAKLNTQMSIIAVSASPTPTASP